MLDLVEPSAPAPRPDPPSWTDQLEAWATLGAAVVALAAAVATIWLLVHQIGETRRARAQAHQERTEAAEDRARAQEDRALAKEERQEAQRAQARTILFETATVRPGATSTKVDAVVTNFGTGPILDVSIRYLVPGGHRVLEQTVVLAPTRSLSVDTTVAAGEGGLVMFFTDMAGLSWARLPGEQPTPASRIDPGPLI
ncbi:hypothetical protein AB0F81_14300 [Actinoplanes sp. NPDC024001]|uniref:hypothetical protein n=1 Tax=Actinoplanes sp. NPDC024001 TaxID=3154598 RepID=UPI00340C9BDB